MSSPDAEHDGRSEEGARGAHYFAVDGHERPAETGPHSGDRKLHGKDGVAGSIPAGGSTPRLTSANANQSSFWVLRLAASLLEM